VYGALVLDRLSPAALDLLASSAVATVVTLDPDGSPHVSVAWVGIEGGEIVFGTLEDQRKLRNLRLDPRIAVSIQSDHINAWGLREYLVLNGRARITRGGAAELLQRLARTYIGPEAVFPGIPDPPPGFVTRMRVDRVAGVGPWRNGDSSG
jgi:PPOX class probable F420-dependent enzyme